MGKPSSPEAKAQLTELKVQLQTIIETTMDFMKQITKKFPAPRNLNTPFSFELVHAFPFLLKELSRVQHLNDYLELQKKYMQLLSVFNKELKDSTPKKLSKVISSLKHQLMDEVEVFIKGASTDIAYMRKLEEEPFHLTWKDRKKVDLGFWEKETQMSASALEQETSKSAPTNIAMQNFPQLAPVIKAIIEESYSLKDSKKSNSQDQAETLENLLNDVCDQLNDDVTANKNITPEQFLKMNCNQTSLDSLLKKIPHASFGLFAKSDKSHFDAEKSPENTKDKSNKK